MACIPSRFPYSRAFSLVELSIVLVILGLLTGGILAGQSLIRAAELRSISADLSRYMAATNAFRDQYNAWPGDMTNAQSFWGVRAAGTNFVCQRTLNVTTGTCNSDGNGFIDEVSGDTSHGERFLFWQHLAYAGLVEGSYTGASNNTGYEAVVVGSNAPPGKLSNSYYYMFVPGNNQPISGDTEYYDGPYSKNTFGLRTVASPAILKPDEAWSLDTKLDDGKPATGAFFSWKRSGTWTPNCATSDALSAEYNVSATGTLCPVIFEIR